MNIKHRVGEMKKTRNPNENRRGKTRQCPFIFSVRSGGGASVTSLWAGLRATPIICARMTIGKIAPRGQWCRRARHGAAGQHVSYRLITTQHIVHATGDSD